MFNSESYKKHQEFIEVNESVQYIKDTFDENSPIFHFNEVFFKHLNPLIESNDRWLTVGDYSGIDAAYLKRKGAYTVASDLSIKKMVSDALPKGLIDECSVQNVENLTFDENSFDYVCCKEAYHHFPRPAIGFYEMLRVAKKGVVILEPNDIGLNFPILIAVRNILDRFNTRLLKKIWKNQYSYEIVGNFVYKVSFREFEKMATALDLPYIASKGFNTNVGARWQTKSVQIIKKFFVDLLCKTSLIPYQHLAIIVLKESPSKNTIGKLKAANFRIYKLPENPYN
jgi:ubiquinone/menaquinone biosynthesis C-methylase UbiE